MSEDTYKKSKALDTLCILTVIGMCIGLAATILGVMKKVRNNMTSYNLIHETPHLAPIVARVYKQDIDGNTLYHLDVIDILKTHKSDAIKVKCRDGNDYYLIPPFFVDWSYNVQD